ncbi:hypothetical protein G6L37_32095 [Agrobacterium rubi]|uniref:DUF7007 domain-containing protein n=1 Tax=Agrobacterium rubi TaxID=28099 RepID=UPI001574BCBB|nr:hypothetical protein [Agrobacterium rubi]NTF10639.1 hypothetical protein [Agrobacterium rubi]NTF23033.1 hypothetical protein [Agrobacterium rubi]NTF29964.1 hypothetical protein [Agrobacterium rubi]
MSTTSLLYGTTRDGLVAAQVCDQAFAMIPSEGGYYIVKAWGLKRPIEDWTIADFHDRRTDPVDETGFRRAVEEWAAHVVQLADLNRRTVSLRTSTPWGQSQHAVFYADGIIAHSTASHGGFALSPDRNRIVPATIRVPNGFYEEDCAWVAVPVTYPELFTDFEKRQADDILRHVYPQAWEAAHSQVLQPGQSRAKDRDRFDRDNADRWVVISAIQSRQHPGFVECIAMLGGRRSAGGRGPADEQRRYLVDDALYDIGTFGFVIDEARDRRYDGPSSFVGWTER